MKKGLSQEYLIGVIILVVTLVLLVMIILLITRNSQQTLKDSACEKSIRAHIETLKITKGAMVPDIDCPTKEITIKGDKENAEHQIAESMRECWKTWQEGKANMFSKETSYCHVCYILDFDKKMTIDNFDKYLSTTKVKGKDYTYTKYLTGYGNDAAYSSELLEKNMDLNQFSTSIDTSKKQAVIFYYSKDSKVLEAIKSQISGMAKGATIGAIAGGVIFGVAGLICGPFSETCVPVFAKGGVLVGGGIGMFIGNYASEDFPQWYAMTILREHSEQSLKEMGCTTGPTNQNNI